MAENPDSSQYWPDIPYDFSRYVYINNHSGRIEDLLQLIYEGAKFRYFRGSKTKKWKWIVVKYPNKAVALREAIKLRKAEIREKTFRADLAPHELSFLAKLERDECQQFSAQKSTALILYFPERISLEQWQQFLAKFAKQITVSKINTTEGKPALQVTCETLAEVAGITLALHNHEVDGRKLYVKLVKKDKELFLIRRYKECYEKCSCILKRCSLHPPEPPRKEDLEDEGTSTKKRKLSDPSLVCSFCRYPGIHPDVKDYVEMDANTRDISWAEEFTELERNEVGVPADLQLKD